MKLYVVYGLLITSLFLVAGTRGYVISGMAHSAMRGGGFFGHSTYHK